MWLPWMDGYHLAPVDDDPRTYDGVSPLGRSFYRQILIDPSVQRFAVDPEGHSTHAVALIGTKLTHGLILSVTLNDVAIHVAVVT